MLPQGSSVLSTIRYDPYLSIARSFNKEESSHSQYIYAKLDSTLTLAKEARGYRSDPHGTSLTNFQDQNKHNGTMGDQLTVEGFSADLNDETLQSNDVTDILRERFLCLPQHLSRINLSIAYFHCKLSPISFSELLDLLLDALINDANVSVMARDAQLLHLLEGKSPYKMRVLIDGEGDISVEAHKLPSLCIESPTSVSNYFISSLLSGFLENRDSPTWDLFIDTAPTVSGTPFTTFKTTFREYYSQSRMRLMDMVPTYRDQSQDKTHCEMVLYNDKNQLMEGTITNIAVRREITPGKSVWITPSLSSGCLCGIFRYFLLQLNLIQEGEIDIFEVKVNDDILIFNGVMGCVRGIIRA